MKQEKSGRTAAPSGAALHLTALLRLTTVLLRLTTVLLHLTPVQIHLTKRAVYRFFSMFYDAHKERREAYGKNH